MGEFLKLLKLLFIALLIVKRFYLNLFSHLDIAALLIKFNTAVNSTDRWGFTPLHEVSYSLFLLITCLFNFNMLYSLGCSKRPNTTLRFIIAQRC